MKAYYKKKDGFINCVLPSIVPTEIKARQTNDSEGKPDKPPIIPTICPPRYAEGAISDNRIRPTKKPKREC